MISYVKKCKVLTDLSKTCDFPADLIKHANFYEGFEIKLNLDFSSNDLD